jgi:hypothetical protein
MLLKDKHAVVHGAGGPVGSAVATRSPAREPVCPWPAGPA